MNDKHIRTIEAFLSLETADKDTRLLQESVGMMSTELAHYENKLQVILGILSTPIENYNSLERAADNTPLIGLITLE